MPKVARGSTLKTTHCVLAVPAHNEAASITRCLSSVSEARLPRDCEWREWCVLDDGSTDQTAEQVRHWARENPTIPLKLVQAPSRRGKIGTVKSFHEGQVAEGYLQDIIVFMDADVTIRTDALTALLGEFDDAEVAAATGLSLPNRRRVGCLSSAFQIALAANFAQELGPNFTRIEGRFFAYRLGALANFHLRAGLIVDDTQLTEFLMEHKLRVRSAFRAVVNVTPAASYWDFYKQTYRALQAAALAGPRFTSRTYLTAPFARRALLRTVRADPMGAIAYIAARIAAALLHRIRPVTFTDQYLLSESTKV